MPLQTAVNPTTNETAVLVGNEWKVAKQIAVNPQDQSKAYLVDGAWMTDTGTSNLPVPKTTSQKVFGAIKDAAKWEAKAAVGNLETAGSLVTGAVSTPVAGLAGIAKGTYNTLGDWTGWWKPGKPADELIHSVQEGMTYQPRTQMGQKISGAVGEGLSYVSSKPGEWVGEHGRRMAEKLGASPELSGAIGAAGNTMTQVVPQILLAKGAGAVKSGLRPRAAGEVPPGAAGARAAPGAAGTADAAAAAQARAKSYVGNLGLDWGALSAEFQAKLTGIAQDAQGLGKLNPEAVKRQALLAEVGINNPTKGQVTRDPLQQRAEQLARATGPGQALRDLDLEHNAKLLEGVEKLRARVTAEALPTGSKARGDLPVGRSVQDTALRAKEQQSMNRIDNLYKTARKTEPDATTPVDALYNLLGKNPHIQHLGWVNSWLKRAKVEVESPEAAGEAFGKGDASAEKIRRPVTLEELQDLRQEANGIIRGGGTDAHYASQVKAAVDEAMENVPEGAKAWKAANDAFRKHKQEFADQTAVRNLVEDKPYTSDRRVAIEETAQKTVTGKLEDLQKVKRSLLTGGQDAGARAAGKIAWRDLKGWGLDYIRERMTKGVKNEAGDPHTTWVGLKKALDDIGDENLDELYGPTARKQLRRYQEAAEILWTEGSTRVKGSPTLDKILTFLDRLGGASAMVGGKLVTDPAAAAVKGISNVAKFGEERRAVSSAMRSPLDEQLTATRRDVRRKQNLANRKEFARKTAPLAPAAEGRTDQAPAP